MIVAELAAWTDFFGAFNTPVTASTTFSFPQGKKFVKVALTRYRESPTFAGTSPWVSIGILNIRGFKNGSAMNASFPIDRTGGGRGNVYAVFEISMSNVTVGGTANNASGTLITSIETWA